jgi:hypothetical protein
MKRAWEIRLVAISFAFVMLASAMFTVLFVEQRKRIALQNEELASLLSWLQASDEARRAYYEGLPAEREKLRKQMTDSKAQYEDLLSRQPDLIKSGQQQVTKVVNEVVPVQVKTTTPAVSSSTKSTRSTKTS